MCAYQEGAQCAIVLRNTVFYCLEREETPTSVTPSQMPHTQRSEAFSMAYVRAIAAQAGVNIYKPDFDFGTDLSFTRIDPYQSPVKAGKQARTRYRDNHSISIPFQVKSSMRWEMREEAIAYDLEVKNYNDLINSTICLLILMCLPPTTEEWLHQDEDGLHLHKCCYYWQPAEEDVETPNDETKRILVPRCQMFTVEALTMLLNERQRGLHL